MIHILLLSVVYIFMTKKSYLKQNDFFYFIQFYFLNKELCNLQGIVLF